MKTTISGIIAAISAFFAFIAVAPPELQNQIPQLFPEKYRGFIALGLAFIAAAARSYQAKVTPDAPKRGSDPTKFLLLPFLLCLSLSLGGCSSLSTPEGKAKMAATGQWLAGKVASIAIQGVVNAAVSQGDASNKADWLDSFAAGARASVSADDFKAIASIWAPAKEHWTSLATEIEAAVPKELTTQQRLEAVARGLNEAAAAARSKAASGRWDLDPSAPSPLFRDRPVIVTNGN